MQGRPANDPQENRTARVATLLTPAECSALDAERGETTRSDFLRRLLLERLSRKDDS